MVAWKRDSTGRKERNVWGPFIILPNGMENMKWNYYFSFLFASYAVYVGACQCACVYVLVFGFDFDFDTLTAFCVLFRVQTFAKKLNIYFSKRYMYIFFFWMSESKMYYTLYTLCLCIYNTDVKAFFNDKFRPHTLYMFVCVYVTLPSSRFLH